MKIGPCFLNLFANFCLFCHKFLHFWLFELTFFHEISKFVNGFLIIPEFDASFRREVFLFFKILHILIRFWRRLSKICEVFCFYFEINYQKNFGAPSVSLVSFCCQLKFWLINL